MKILMTNHALGLGGTESWTRTMADELVKRGHDVTIFTLMPGRAEKLMPCPVVTEVPAESPDLILVNHNTCLGMVQHLPAVKIFTSHGPYHPVEKFKQGADAYVAVSEEVWACGIMAGFRPRIIRNPIDLERFRPRTGMFGFEGDALILLKNQEACQVAYGACEMAGMERVTIAHEQINPIEDIANVMPHYRTVIGGGRGILEALACGCAAFCLNSLNLPTGLSVIADGWVTPDNILDFRMFNCSSRYHQEEIHTDTLAEMLKNPAPTYGHPALNSGMAEDAWGRFYVEEHNDVRRVVDAYLALAEQVMQEREEAVTT